MTYEGPVLASDEHEVPTQLDERVPMIPLLFPFDWTQRQVYWMSMCFFLGAQNISTAQTGADWLGIVGYFVLGFLGVFVEYVCRPNPEFWISVWLEYLGVLMLSFPLWWQRLLPQRDQPQGINWPLATMPHWLGRRMLANFEIEADGVLKLPGRPGQRNGASYAVVIGIEPRPHPDLMAMMLRQAMIQTRLGILRRIHGNWSIHLQVRPFDARALEVASGPAWGWVAVHMAPVMVLRRPLLVLHGPTREALVKQINAILLRFQQAKMTAWMHSADETKRLAAELWSDLGKATSGRVRIGVRRVVTGHLSYRSWALVELPRIIHLAWLRPLTSESLLCDVAMHVSVRPPGATKRSLQRKIRRWRGVDQDDDYALGIYDAQRTIDSMRRNLDTAASIGVYVTAREEQADQVAEALETAQCEFKPANLMQHRALRATRPLGGDPFRRRMQADLSTVATTDLLATAGYWPVGATLLGEALSAPEPIGLNLFDEQNLNWAMFVAIMQGGGKTTTAQTLAWRMCNPHPDHVLAERTVGDVTFPKLQLVSVDFKASGDYANLYRHLADRGQVASYNAWSSGPLPELHGHMGFNLSDVPEEQHGEKLLELTARIEEWANKHSLERPMLLLLDEVLALIEARNGPGFIRRFGTQGRSLNIAPVFMSQDIEAILANRKAALAFKNCSHILVGRQNPAGLNAMVPLLSLDEQAQVLLADAPQGSGLLRIERRDGPRVLGLQVRPTEWEIQEFGTNPTERVARWRAERRAQQNMAAAATLVGKEAGNTNGHLPVAVADRDRPDGLEAVADADPGLHDRVVSLLDEAYGPASESE